MSILKKLYEMKLLQTCNTKVYSSILYFIFYQKHLSLSIRYCKYISSPFQFMSFCAYCFIILWSLFWQMHKQNLIPTV